MYFPIPRDVQDIIEAYENNGFHAHIVGGPVRDYLLGIPPHDFDITTDATPEETKQIFRGERIIETGIQHGTVTLLKSSTPYEITTYRIDGEYLDQRHPESVTFTRSLAEDLARRDFTVNAMAYAHSSGIVDLFSGQEDLKNHILRAVGLPEKRFEEDALRILRALRFRSRLGFDVEENTKKAIFSLAPLMRALATERILNEFYGILVGAYAEDVLREYRTPLAQVLPEFEDAFCDDALPTKVSAPLIQTDITKGREMPPCQKNATISDIDDIFFCRFVALAHRAGLTAEEYVRMCDRLHTSRHLRDDGAKVLSVLHQKPRTDYDLLKLLSLLDKELTVLALELLIWNKNAQECARGQLERLLLDCCPYRITDLAVSGRDLLMLGYRGKELGDTLSLLLDATMRGDVPNEKDALLSYLK